ncbi:sulfotransferase family protein [Pikeienuella piscinae]|uniref:Sulfotransferase family protein n=1 Tax=Pikeienuella piscinae TaxID=2748098 RepID=A0A7L5BU73_9RHOB|nr:sulfotransferase family protein [Pikeienuella piscinae]QIE54493.1 sulfotransferase family protein [Pikeienuella piscinae]
MALDIIGAGFGRTGTNSLKLALELLGFGPCHHMFEIRDNPALLPAWEAVAAGGAPDLDAVFKGYRSQVDWPGARYWRESAARWPEAKVVLSVRDPDLWFESVQATILPTMEASGTYDTDHANRLTAMARTLVMEKTFAGRLSDRAHAIGVYEAHNAAVRDAIPASRLLVMDVAEGWRPLCRFLGVEEPGEPFPMTNSSREFKDIDWENP